MIFLTGDLGFMALEPLQVAMANRFINAGVAEQNMISVAAALSRQRFDVWVYSIAPFVYARPFEQVRNDIGFHNLPVKLIGNGGGYAYGVMGPTHHAIDDYGSMLLVPNMTVYAPAFEEDIAAVVNRAGASLQPVYLRLGVDDSPSDYVPPAYAPYRQLVEGGGPVVIVVGPLVGGYVLSVQSLPANERPNLWVVTELLIDLSPPPIELLRQIEKNSSLLVAEEHVAHGSFGSSLLLHLASQGVAVKKFKHLFARAHLFERYGSQTFLRRQSKLDANALLAELEKI
jgi:transketolase